MPHGIVSHRAGSTNIGRATPEELTGAALLLTDPESGYVTGTVLPVDGGWTSH